MQDTVLLDQIAELSEAFPNLGATVTLSDEAPDMRETGRLPNIRFKHGLVHEIARNDMRGRYSDITAFLAGPPPMVEAAIRTLVIEAKLPTRNIRYDKFS